MFHWFPSFRGPLFRPIFGSHPKSVETGGKCLLGVFIWAPKEGRQRRRGTGEGEMLAIYVVFCTPLFLDFY